LIGEQFSDVEFLSCRVVLDQKTLDERTPCDKNSDVGIGAVDVLRIFRDDYLRQGICQGFVLLEFSELE
jgi:hypothetical protein